MKYVKMLGLLAVAAAAMMAFAGSASAAVLTSPAGTTYTGSIHASSEGPTSLHSSSGAIVTCQNSTVTGSVKTHGGEFVHGDISTLDFSECGTDHVTVKNKGSLTINSSGTVYSTGAQVFITLTNSPLGHLSCEYTTNGTHIGLLTESSERGGSTATLDIQSANIPRTGGSFFCGGSGVWTGNYIVSTPDFLDVS